MFLARGGGRAARPRWTRTWGASRLVADALGRDAASYDAASYDAASYDAEGRRLLLGRELDWLLGPSTS